MDSPPQASVGMSYQQVHPWDYLIKQLQDELDSSELTTLMIYMQGPEVDDDSDDHSMEQHYDEKVKQMFQKMMTKDEDFRNTAKKLQKALNYLQYHMDGKKISSFVKSILMQYCAEPEQGIFVGRDNDIEAIVKALTTENKPCVMISGPGGQGKTTLANHVCQHLNWYTLRVVMSRDKKLTSDILKEILLKHGRMLPSTDEELVTELKAYLKNLPVYTVIFVDHCDFMRIDDNKGDNHRILVDILNFIQEHLYTKVRFLMTTAVKLDKKILKGEVSELFKQVELEPLNKPAAIELLCKSSGEDIPQMQAEEIVKECGCSPLAVTAVADMIRQKTFTVERLLFHLKMDEKNTTEALKVSNCVKVAIDSLDNEVKESLYRLVVFQDSSFHKKSLEKVLNLNESKSSEHLSKLINAHLLDCRKSLKIDSQQDDDSKGKYSLQPLVYKYVHECIQRRQIKSSLQDAVRDATTKFVELYEERISHLVFKMDTKCLKAMKSLEFEKMHIKNYYSILENKKPLLKPYPRQSQAKDFLKKKRVSDLADLVLSDVQKRRLYKSEAARAKSDGNDAMFILWTVEEADVYLLLSDKPTIAKDLLDGLSQKKYPALQRLDGSSYYPHLVHALFHKVKGLTLWKLLKPVEALHHLFLALKFYEHFNTTDLNLPVEVQRSDKRYVCLHARVYSAIGQIYIELERFDEAWKVLEKGYSMTKSVIETKGEDSELQWDIPRYYSKFGRILLKTAQMEQDPGRKLNYLNDALENLNKGMSLDIKLKMDNLDDFCVKRKLKADVFVEKGEYEQALKEAEAALDQRRAIIQPPHFKYLESVYQVARIYLLIGNRYQAENIEEARKWWLTSRDYFKEMEEHHLVNGSIQVGHPLLNEIKRDHLEVRQRYDGENSKSVKEVVQFYQKLEKGKFKSKADSYLKSFQTMMYTPQEFLKQVFGSGGRNFGEKDTRMEVLEKHAGEQIERMVDGNYGAERHDSDHPSFGSDIDDPMSEESGSISTHIQSLRLEESASLEDKVFEQGATSDNSGGKVTKRQRTNVED